MTAALDNRELAMGFHRAGRAKTQRVSAVHFWGSLTIAILINAGALSLCTRWRHPSNDPTSSQVIEAVLAPSTPPIRRRAEETHSEHALKALSPEAPSTPAFVRDDLNVSVPSEAEGSGHAIEPKWQVDGGAYLNPQTAKQALAFFEMKERLRFERACIGLSNETMTSNERELCYKRWAAIGSHAGQ